MDYLNTRYGIATLRLSIESSARDPLVEQIAPFLALTPYVVLDVAGVALTSLRIGELVNLVNSGRELWGEDFHGVFLVNASPQARQVIGTTRLAPLLRVYDDVNAAHRAVTEERALRSNSVRVDAAAADAAGAGG